MAERYVPISDSQWSKIASLGVDPQAFVTQAIEGALDQEQFDAEVQHRFTPEVVAHLDAIAADLDAGARTHTGVEVREHLARYADKRHEKRQA